MIFNANCVCRAVVAVAVSVPDASALPTRAGVGLLALGAGAEKQLRPRLQRIRIIHTVEDVEEFRAELDVERLTQRRNTIILHQRHIEVRQPRPVDRVAPGVAQDRVVGRCLGRVGVTRRVDVRTEDRLTRIDRVTSSHAVREVEVVRTTQPKRVPTDQRSDGQPRASLEDAAILPAIEHPTGRAERFGRIRQQHQVIEDEVLSNVEIRHTMPVVLRKERQAAH